jgi:hypothetical protein
VAYVDQVALLTGALLFGAVFWAVIDRAGRWARDRGWIRWRRRQARERRKASAWIEEFHALYYSSKRHELEQRGVEMVLRDDEHDGAPPRTGIDLDRGKATIHRRPRRP